MVPRPWRPPLVVDIGIDLASSVTRGVVTVTRTGLRVAAPFARLVTRPPVVPQKHWPQSYLRSMADQGRLVRERREQQVLAQLKIVVPAIVGAVVDWIDLNQLVIEKVDFEKVIAAVDFEKVIAAIDVGQIVKTLDIDSIAREILVNLDVPELIRESSGAMASETVVGVRMRGMEADERVANLVDRLMRRRGGRGAAAEDAAAQPGPQEPGRGSDDDG